MCTIGSITSENKGEGVRPLMEKIHKKGTFFSPMASLSFLIHQMYYPPFEGAIAAGVGSVMCSYNRIQPEGSTSVAWACENPATLADLKQDLNFTGFVMSDWGATHSTSLPAGLDMEMPDGRFLSPSKVKEGMRRGDISKARVDDAVLRILTPLFAVGVMDAEPGAWDATKHSVNASTPDNIATARNISAHSTVLLKNNGVLPIQATSKIAIIGLADGKTAIYGGHGSGEVVPSHAVPPLEALSAYAKDHGGSFTYSEGFSNVSSAVAAALKADVAVVFVGTTSGEGGDRSTLALPSDQDALVRAILASQPQTVVCVASPGAVLLPWSRGAAAILATFMPGQQAGPAITSLLYGEVNPSGKLPLTFPNKENELNFTPEQWPGVSAPDEQFTQANYTERLLVGYRYYDQMKIKFTTGFPFGHGLSYSTFNYSKLQAKPNSVSCTITNTGSVAGAEVAQLYLSFPASAGEPPNQLKGFQKVLMKPGEEAEVMFPLSPRHFSTWSSEECGWRVVAGRFGVHVGSSSRDMRLQGTILISTP